MKSKRIEKMKPAFLIIFSLFIWSCNTTTSNKSSHLESINSIKLNNIKSDTIFWHKNQVIEQIIKESDSVYVIHIGIMAQAFQLENKNNAHFYKDLQLLNKSLFKRIKLTIGIENNSNRIVSVIEN